MSKLRDEHREIVRNSAIAAGLAGVPGAVLPVIDVVAIVGIWATMIVKIAETSGRRVERDLALKVAASIAKGAILYWAGNSTGGTATSPALRA